MNAKESIKSQYWASLEMLRQAILQCPDSLWQSAEYQNPFWHVAYHAIFYAHLYLHATEADFAPWEKHRPEVRSLKASSEGKESAYSKE
ncbi:MAG: hypothetical protein ACK2U9_17575, partial [Anaerolineae bacterium]